MRGFVTLLLALLGTGVWAGENQLHLFIWSEYIDPEIVADFEKEYACKVTIDLYEDNESMIAKLAGGGVSLYDIVVPSDYVLTAMIERRLLAPLRHENIPNLANLDPKFANTPADPGNRYTAPYLWGTVGIYMRAPADQPVKRSWGLIFDPELQPGPFLLMDDMRAAFAAALKYRGYPMNTRDPHHIREAGALLLDAKKRSLGFEGGVGGKNRVMAQGCRLAMVYNGDAVRGTKEDAETIYFVPDEGGELWLDSMAIPAQAPNRAMAEKFINYILDARVGGRLANYISYATPNKAALEHVLPEDRANPGIYPPPEMMGKLELLEDLGKDTRLYDEMWTRIKSK